MEDWLVHYSKLYKLQDQVLEVMFENPACEFYLTGGTCLNRFYFEERYSDDLDFFTHHSDSFAFSVKNILEQLQELKGTLDHQVSSRDFIRVVFKQNEVSLQLDFVNDRVPRFGDIARYNQIRIDNLDNILSNKLTAILSRDNPKDIFDLLIIDKNVDIHWPIILEQANEKSVFQLDDLIYRLESFPVELLKGLRVKYQAKLETMGTDQIKTIINRLLETTTFKSQE